MDLICGGDGISFAFSQGRRTVHVDLWADAARLNRVPYVGLT
jgi:hypothetical protein